MRGTLEFLWPTLRKFYLKSWSALEHKDSSKWIKSKGVWYRDFHWQDGYGAFSIGESGVPALKRYIAKQKEHHKKIRFEDEFIALLKKYNIEYDERYLWD